MILPKYTRPIHLSLTHIYSPHHPYHHMPTIKATISSAPIPHQHPYTAHSPNVRSRRQSGQYINAASRDHILHAHLLIRRLCRSGDRSILREHRHSTVVLRALFPGGSDHRRIDAAWRTVVAKHDVQPEQPESRLCLQMRRFHHFPVDLPGVGICHVVLQGPAVVP